ncbi:hypothetical protein A4S05_31015 [Nostoc sp. KVJ20]|uniref:hypothetical protein n=1 Tax=unclassified Nostoc TaxID=2593658 RepID=UPI00083D23F4|nr:hypothetical protein [Nostoc sp. KVJ20]ODH01013.1 hypothetical protein A4S05_31015 [Nostoc sp. KVJ20]
MQTTPVRWMTAGLQLFASDSHSKTLREHRNRYEIINPELFMTLNTEFRKSTKRDIFRNVTAEPSDSDASDG